MMLTRGEWPMDWTGCELVERVPGKVSGVPILKHSRVQADTVWESYELGETVEETVDAVIRFAEARRPVSSLR
jgi:uncharacterized protein (DUF433 family)